VSLEKLYRFVLESVRSMEMYHFHDISWALNGRKTTQYVDFCHLSEDGNRAVADAMAGIILASTEEMHLGPGKVLSSQLSAKFRTKGPGRPRDNESSL
jgi:hypothetical protein